MMTREDRQEALSLAYVHAVAAAAGMAHSYPIPDYGIDLGLHEVADEYGEFVESGRAIDLQVKSTIAAIETSTSIRYDLRVRAYDILRAVVPCPRFLVLHCLPQNEAEWVKQTRSRIEVRGGLFWASLRGRPAVRNRATVRIDIPRRQVFTATALRVIMGQA